MRFVNVAFRFERRDFWVGCYWTLDWVGLSEFGPIEGIGERGLTFLRALEPPVPVYRRLTLCLCLIPCLPIRIRLLVGKPSTEGSRR